MATINVERFRKNTDADPDENGIYPDRTDADTIQKAVYSLKDGDTLLFNKKAEILDEDTGEVTGYDTTYRLDNPVYFTLFNVTTDENGNLIKHHKTRNRITIDGCGCTVCGSSDFIRDFGGTGENNKNALFYISDDTKFGLKHCTIKNFIFKWNESGEANGVAIKNRNIGVGVITSIASNDTSTKAVYFSNGIIENCEFHNFRVGLYQCGDDSVVRDCKFQFCREGIYSDGSVHNVFENNNFLATTYIGLHMNISYDSTARNNKFHACQNYSIFVNGHFDDTREEEDIRVSVIDNKIFGRYMDAYYIDEENYDNTRFVTDIGIKLQGMQNAIITGNHIAGISRDKRFKDENDMYGYGHGYGFGIELSGNVDCAFGEGVCINKNILVSDNVIYDCYGGGIKVKDSVGVKISNNIITNNPERGIEANTVNNVKKYGILVTTNTRGIIVSNNMTCRFNLGTDISIPENNRFVVSQCNEPFKFNFNIDEFLKNARIIEDATYSAPYITIPDTVSNLSNKEKFRMKIPDNYTESAMLIIRYNNADYMLYNNNPKNSEDTSEAIKFPSSMNGKYVWLEYRLVNGAYQFFFIKNA